MAVKFTLIGSQPGSDEYEGAVKLMKTLEAGLPGSAEGEIVLHPNADIQGRDVKDVDLLVMGWLKNYAPKLSFTGDGEEIITDRARIESFCTVIEIKAHPVSRVSRLGTEFFVDYSDKPKHSVTYQSNQQKLAAISFLRGILGKSPYVTNLIWFTGVKPGELEGLLKLEDGMPPMMSNTLPDEYTAADFFQHVIWQKKPYVTKAGEYALDCFCGREDVEKFIANFAKRRTQAGELTRRRIELITSQAVGKDFAGLAEGKMNICRGTAGTGKTIGLIQAAIRYVEEKEARVIILTYNAALAADIRRLFALAQLPELFEKSCVTIETMHRFFRRLASAALHGGRLPAEEFFSRYDETLGELLAYLEDEEDPKRFLREIMGRDDFLNWDYCFIDEAQDWTVRERDLILKIFGPDRIIVADGGRQFVRKIAACDWKVVEELKSIRLKKCLRQKNNLIRFINHCLDSLGREDARVVSADKLTGGRVVVCADDSRRYQLFRRELELVREAGNIPYDMLFLVPSVMVGKEPRHFRYTEEFERNSLPVWDGTDPEVRSAVNLSGDAVRVLQYDSARGLEGWTVVCIWLDAFLEEKEKYFDDPVSPDALTLESREDRLKEYLLNWLMIPLTRAIDTLVITFRDENSDIAKTLIALAKEYPDYVILEQHGAGSASE